MVTAILIAGVIIAALVVGTIDRNRVGRIKNINNAKHFVTASDIGTELGSVATILQFSSAFCAPCRITRGTLSTVVTSYTGIKHVEIDAEKNLELVRRLDIKQTPTTLFIKGDGYEIARAVGAPKRDQVINAIELISQ